MMVKTIFLFLGIIAISLMEASLGGCVYEEEVTGVSQHLMPSAGVMLEDASYMQSKFRGALDKIGTSETIKIDLADERQYRFVVNRLFKSGNTPENSPHLFWRIEHLRKTASASSKISNTTATTAKDWCAHGLPLHGQFINTTTIEWRALVRGSCSPNVDIAEYAYADVAFYEQNLDNSNPIVLGSNATEEYGEAYFENLLLQAPRASSVGRKIVADSILYAYGSSGQEQLTYTIRETDGEANELPSITSIQHPVERIGTGERVVRSCIQRGVGSGNLDCDYSSVRRDPVTGVFSLGNPRTGIAGVIATATTTWAPDPTTYYQPAGPFDIQRLYVPIKGRYDAGTTTGDCRITSINAEPTKATLYLVDAGGYCKDTEGAPLDPNDPISAISLAGHVSIDSTNSRFANFDFLADFGKDCTGYQNNVKLELTISAQAVCPGFTTPRPRQATRDLSTVTSVGFLDFKNSCFAEGTEILMADGSRKAVQDISVGDSVLGTDDRNLDRAPMPLTVSSTVLGSESKPMVRLKDSHGHVVLVTEKHPVVTATKGIVTADTISTGDEVVTIDGISTIEAVERVEYEGEVYNLAVGSADQVNGNGKEGGMVFANGFLMGDAEMQDNLARLSMDGGISVPLTQISPHWYMDYLHDRVRKHFSIY